jgi:hypothetical protein
VLRGFLEVRPPCVKINPRPSGVRVGVIRADQLLEFCLGSPTTESGDQGSDRKRGVIDDEGVRGRSPEPAGGRQRRVLQAAEPLLRRLEGVRVRPRRGLRQKILWKGLALKQRVSYHQLTLQFEDYKVWEDTPPEEYEDEQALPFLLSFVTPRTVRLRMAARPQMYPDGPSLILDGDPPTDDSSWRTSSTESSTTYEGPFGSVTVTKDPATPSTRPPAACGWPTTCRPANCRAGAR